MDACGALLIRDASSSPSKAMACEVVRSRSRSGSYLAPAGRCDVLLRLPGLAAACCSARYGSTAKTAQRGSSHAPAMTRRLKVQLVALFGICVAAYAWNVVSGSAATLASVAR
jgi:hypothetical protein